MVLKRYNAEAVDEVSGDPNALADVLLKIPRSAGGLQGLFSTYPPTGERIARLRAIDGWA